eukprot:COSAG01_NODE_1303_length_10815_cov_14.897938_8_plen_1330_part_00
MLPWASPCAVRAWGPHMAELFARLSRVRNLGDIVGQGGKLLSAATTVLDWGSDALYLRDVYRGTIGLYEMTEADTLACLDEADKNDTCADWGALRTECGADVTIEVGAGLLGALALCNVAGFVGDVAKGYVALRGRAGGVEAHHRRHGMLEVVLVLVEDVPMLALTLHIEYTVKPQFLPGDAAASPFAVMSMVFGLVNGLVRAIAGLNEYQNARDLAEQDDATERTDNVLYAQKQGGDLDLDENVRAALTSSTDVIDLTGVTMTAQNITVIGAYLDKATTVISVKFGRNACELTIRDPEVTKLDLAGQDLAPDDVKLVAMLMTDGLIPAVVTSVNCLKNPLGDDGLATLTAAVETSSVGSICGLTEGQTTVDWSKQKLGPFDCQIIAADFGFRRFSAALASLNMSGNFPAGRISKDNDHWLPGKDFDSWTAVCDAVQGSQITEWNISDCYLGPDAMTILSTRLSAVLAKVNVLSNPIGADGADALIEVYEKNTNLRTLLGIEEGVTEVNLSQKNVDPGQAKILAAELKASRAAAALTEVNASGNPLTGGYVNSNGKIDEGHDISGVSVLFPAMTKIITLNISNCGLGPSGMPELSKLVRDARAVLARVSVLSNPIGTDGADALIQVFNQNTNLRTLLGIEEGVTELNLSKKNVDPGQAKILAAELKASRAVAALASLTLSGNKITGTKFDSGWKYDVDMSGFSSLCQVLGKLNEVNLSDCGLGPASMPEVAKTFSDAEAVLASLTLSGNRITGTKNEGRNWTYDADLSGFTSLCQVLGKLNEVNLSNCHLGPASMPELAKAFSDADAASVEVILDGNPIGCPSSVSLKPGADAGVDLKVGVFATIEGHWAQVTVAKPGSDPTYEVVLLQSGTKKTHNTQRNFLRPKDLHNVVASRADLIEDYSHIRSLGETLSGSQVHTCSLANCNFNSVTLVTFVESVTWETAALASLTLSGNPLTGAIQTGPYTWDKVDSEMDGFVALCAVLGKLTEVDLSDCHLGVASTAELAKVFSDADAVIAHVALSGNAITGSVDIDNLWAKYDLDLSGIIALGEAVAVSKTLTSIDLSKCAISVAGVTEVAKFISAEAALASLNVIGNAIGEPGARSLIEVFDANPRLQSLLGVKPGSTSADFSKTNMQPHDCIILAHELNASRAAAVLTSVNCLKNPLGDEGLATLVTAVQASSVGSICGLTEGQTTIDWSKQELGPFDCKIIAADFGFRRFSAALTTLRCGSNPGMVGEVHPNGRLKTPDVHIEALQELLNALKPSGVTELDISAIGIGPTGADRVADYVRDARAALAQVDIRGAHVEETDLEALRAAAPEGCEVVWERS